MSNDTTGVLWKRLRNFLSPQMDIYSHIADHITGKDVFEIGFGTGFGTLQLTRTANHVDACEIDEDAVKFAKKAFPRGVIWFKHDITEKREQKHSEDGAPLPPNRYDAIVCIETLEHIPDVDAALKSIVFHLREGGVAYISSPNANADLRKTDLHEREWTAKEFMQAMKKYFSDVRLYDYSLTKEQGEDSTATPLLAVCKKNG